MSKSKNINKLSKMEEQLSDMYFKHFKRTKIIENCFDEMKVTYGKREDINTSSTTNPPITQNGTPLTDSMLDYRLTCIRRLAMCDDYGGLSGNSEATVIALNGELQNDAAPFNFEQTLHKVLINEGRKEVLGRTVIRVQFSDEEPNFLYLNESEMYPAAIYLDGNADTAYLVCELEPGRVHVYELALFAMLSVIGKSEKGEEGLFSMFRKKHLTPSGAMVDTILENLYVDGTDISQAKFPRWLFPLKPDKQDSKPKETVAEPKVTIPTEAYAVVAASSGIQIVSVE